MTDSLVRYDERWILNQVQDDAGGEVVQDDTVSSQT
jgi:hypothetical protein